MEQEPHNQPAQANSNQENAQAKTDHPRSRKKQPLVRRYLFFAFLAGVAGLASQYVESFDHRLLLPSLVLLFIAFFLGACSLWVLLRNHHATKFNAYLCSIPVGMCGLVLCGFLYFFEHGQPQIEPYPHFTFSILKFGLDTKIELTNKCLVWSKFSKIGDAPDPGEALGYLIVPITNTSSVDFVLEIENNGPTVSEFTEATISISDNLPHMPDSLWRQTRMVREFSAQYPDGTRQTNLFTSWTIATPPILPGNSVVFPPIRFLNVPVVALPNITNCPMITILSRAKDSPAQVVLLKILFLPVPSGVPLPMPFIAEATRDANGHESFAIPPDKIPIFLMPSK
jgi:hypothetical protein